jgi:predicted DNA-binding transcriptional regulator YafY
MILELNKILKMFLYLRGNGKTKLSELSDYIGADERTIRRITKTLKHSGFKLSSKSGKFGGIWLDEPALSDDEWILLKDKLKDNKSIYDKIDYRLNKTF